MHPVKTKRIMVGELFSIKFCSFLIILTVAAETLLFGQARNEFFVERITDGDAPFSVPIADITQDELGFLWLATRQGLYRYDGHQLKAYPHISRDGATSIAIDRRGLIWLGTFMNGVFVYDPRADTATTLTKLIKNISINSPVGDIKAAGDLAWILCQDKLLLVNLKEKSSREIVSTRATSDEGFRSLEIDQKGDVWIGKKHGLLLVRNSNNEAQIFDYSSKVGFETVSAIAAAGVDTLILATSIGRFVLNTKTGYSHPFPLRAGEVGKHTMANNISAILVTLSPPDVWYATTKGLLVEANGKVKTGLHEDTDTHSLGSNDIHCVFRSKDGILFLGTEVGLNRIVKEKQGFEYHKFSSYQSPGNPNAQASAFYEDDQRNLWIGIEGEGLYQLDSNYRVLNLYRQTGILRDRAPATNKPWLYGSSIFALTSDESGIIWVGTDQGLMSIDPFTRKTGIYLQGKRKRGISHYDGKQWVQTDSVMTFDENGIFYIKPFDNFLLVESESENTSLIDARNPDVVVKRYFKSPDTIRQNKLYEDQFGHVIVHDYEGIKIFDKEALDFQIIISADKVPIFVKDIIYDEERACMWILTVQSMEKYTLADKKFVSTQLLENPSHHAMLLDQRGRLWIATNSSILVFDTASRTVTNLTEKDGLRSTHFFDGIVARNGDFLFGDFNGMIQFDPNILTPKKSGRTLLVTGIRTGNKMVDGKPQSNSSQLASIEYKQSATLEYFENSILIQYTDLDLAGSSGFRYAYKIEPVDEDWVVTADLATDVYTRLSPGEYTFLAKQVDENGQDAGPAVEFGIVILPPPWKTWWAYTIYLAAFLFTANFAWNRWKSRMQLKAIARTRSEEAAQLREMGILKSNFFANISHEFRTPLTLLLGPIERRVEQATESADKKELSMMHRNATRLLTLVNQLLDLSRAESGNLRLNCRLADVSRAVLSVQSQFSSIADSKSIRFDVPPSQPVLLFFDADKVEKIVTNLLSNAFKFTPVGGSITLRIVEHDRTEEFKEGYVEIMVADTGIGMEEEHLPRIFDRFYQADMSSTRIYEGSGIGLALTKELVELHRGTVSVASTPGKGTVFVVKLPRGKSHLRADEIDSSAEPERTKNQGVAMDVEWVEETSVEESLALPRILLVEDNADLRHYLRECFKRQFILLEAENGEDGISAAIREVPDLIITDLMMPKANGLQLCQELKEDTRTSHIPIILLTAKVDTETRLETYRQGADDYISKPFQMEELQIRVHNLLANRKRIQEKFLKQLKLSPAAVPVTSVDEKFVKRAMEVIEQFIGDSSFGVENFAQEVGVSHTQLYRKLNALTGFNPNEFIRHMRLLRAADLMRKKAGNVADITYLVGFNNLSYFSKVFKEKFGMTPIEFLKNPPQDLDLNKIVS